MKVRKMTMYERCIVNKTINEKNIKVKCINDKNIKAKCINDKSIKAKCINDKSIKAKCINEKNIKKASRKRRNLNNLEEIRLNLDATNCFQSLPEKIMKITSLLGNEINSTSKVLFYPSAGVIFPEIFDQDIDFLFVAEADRKIYSQKVFFFARGITKRPSISRIRHPAKGISIFQKESKILFFVHGSNEKAYDLIRELGCKISIFIGKRDGCRFIERKQRCTVNYDGVINEFCVNQANWLKKILEISDDTLWYLTDHMQQFYENNRSGKNKPTMDHADRNEQIIRGFVLYNHVFKRDNSERSISSFYHENEMFTRNGSISSYHKPIWLKVEKCNRILNFHKENNKNGLSVSFEHDNILNHIEQLDGMITSTCFPHHIRYLSNKSQNCKFIDDKNSLDILNSQNSQNSQNSLNPQNTQGSTRHYMRWSERKTAFFIKLIEYWLSQPNIKTLGIIAFGSGKHDLLAEFIENFNTFDKKKHLRIFYQHKNDFKKIRSYLARPYNKILGMIEEEEEEEYLKKDKTNKKKMNKKKVNKKKVVNMGVVGVNK